MNGGNIASKQHALKAIEQPSYPQNMGLDKLEQNKQSGGNFSKVLPWIRVLLYSKDNQQGWRKPKY